MPNTSNNDKQAALDKAMATLRAGGSVYLNKYSRARMVEGQIVAYNPEVTQVSEFQAGNSTLTKKKLATAIAAGKVSVISQAQLAAGLNPTPSTPKPKGNAKPKKKLAGTADDDKGKKKKPKVKVRKEADPELSPGKRLKNPLGALSSYNYQLSLYMVTPDALEVFKENGYRDINKLGVLYANALDPVPENSAVSAGAYIVAQSGGVNQLEQRAPSFNFDYGIDNLTFTIAGPKDTGSPAAEYEFNFTITEPYGFSFISNLKRANDAITDYNKRLAKKKAAQAKKKAAAQQQRTRTRKSGPTKTADGKSKNPWTDPRNNLNSPDAAWRSYAADPNQRRNNFSTTKPASNTGKATPTPQTNSKTGKGSTTSTPENPSKQLFVLGIRFYGYNASGQPVRGTDTTAATNAYGQVISTQEIDPGNSSYALFERYYPIIIKEMKTTVDGRETKYNIGAATDSMMAIGSKRGQINNPISLSASTVGEALDQLMSKLNKEQKKLNNNTGSGYSYDIKYASANDADRIRSSKIVSKADLDKYKWPGSGAKNTKESNANTENKKGAKPKNNARKIEIAKGTPILQAINQIISQSAFLEDALRTVYTTALEPDQDKEGLPELDLSGKKTIEWFHCTPDVSNLSWDSNRADWVYNINYILNVYDTPVLDTAYTNPGKKYYGPTKRYEYWYSGTNTEILGYKQVLNNNFYTTFLDPNFGKNKDDKNANKNGGKNTKNASGGSGNAAGATTPLVENQKTGQPTQGKQGNAMEAQNSYMTSLFDPSAQATAEIDILGDPDLMMSTTNTGYGQNESVVYNKFYGSDGYSVSPAGGQVFFEIDFKEAIDYKSGGANIPTKDGSGITGAPGTMSINSSILFWKDPKALSSLVRGISYSLNSVKCSFSNGKFTQKLLGNINTFGDSGSNDDGKARENKSKNTNSGPNKGNANATTSKKGFKEDAYYNQAGRDAAGRLSADPKVRTAAFNKKYGQDAAITQKLNSGIPPALRAKNAPET